MKTSRGVPISYLPREPGHPLDSARKPLALVVDDELVNREILVHILEQHGYESRQAYDAREAFEHLSTEAFDLVLLDIAMPDTDGFDVLKSIRERWSAAELPVIMVTASCDSDQIVEAFNLGANDYLTKPVDVAVTMARITTQMRLKRAQAALRESEERYYLAACGANDGLWDWNLASGEVYYSPRWLEMLGLADSQADRTQELWFQRIHQEDRPRVETELDRHLAGETEHFEAELRMEHTNGGYRWMLCRGLAVRNTAGKAHRIAGSLTDITEGKVADALTSLPNRVLLLERLQRCIDRKAQQQTDANFALLYLDLDNFKFVNDSLGHDAGDQLLVSFSRRLEGCVRATDSVVSRLGGDEFAVLLERIESEQDAIRIAKRIITSIAVPFSLGGGREVYATASVGIGIGTPRCQEAIGLLQEADTAMYQAKARGKSCYCVFDPVMKEKVKARLQIETALRHAVEREELVLHYHPIFHLSSGDLVGFEALVRWQHPEMGLVAPATFIPVAEETGLIIPIGHWILREACRQLGEWRTRDSAFENLTMSVNLSVKQLADSTFESDLLSILNDTAFPPRQLKLEITESTIVESQEDGTTVLARLRERGIGVALDDFGTGFSSLTQLYRLPIDTLKIDQSFVNNVIHCIENRTIVRTIINLAENLHLDVIAEGIENANQKRLLNSMGCQYAQGFYFSQPLAADQVPLRNWATPHHPPRDPQTSLSPLSST